MGTKKDNLWNKIFHLRRWREQRKEKRRLQHIVDVAEDFIDTLAECDDLRTLLHIHKDIWGSGLRNKNIAPNPNGMFRTKDIKNMKAEEVYLGNIYGLWTFTIPEWEKEREHRIGSNTWGINPNITVYELVTMQYRYHLLRNVKAMKKEAEASLKMGIK